MTVNNEHPSRIENPRSALHKTLAIVLIVLGLVGMGVYLCQRTGALSDKSVVRQSGTAPATAQDLLNRWDEAIARTFGPYTAILTEAEIGSDGQASNASGSVGIYRRAGNGWSVSCYLVGASEHAGVKTMPVPAGWPTPRLHDVLVEAPKCTPVVQVEDDGRNVRGIVWNGDKHVPIPTTSRRAAAAEWPLEAQVFYGRFRLGGYDPAASAQYLQDVTQPDRIGILVRAFLRPAHSWEHRVDYEVWCDLQHGYAPQHIRICRYAADAKSLESETTTRVFSFARTSSGGWYPQQWQSSVRRISPGGAEVNRKLGVSLQLQAEAVTSAPSRVD